MKKLLISLTLIAGLALGITVGTAGPASAAQLPPLTYTTVSYAGCQVNFRYGTYGGAFAEVYPLSELCNGLTGVTVAAALPGGGTATKTCNFVDAVFLGTPNCFLIFSQSTPIGVRAVIPGSNWTAYGGTARPCVENPPFGFPGCWAFDYTAFG